jgi:hypothetical protein
MKREGEMIFVWSAIDVDNKEILGYTSLEAGP